MRANFDACLDHVLRSEGGYVDHPADPGGATNMGITHHTLASWRGNPVSKADVRALTRKEAEAIYRSRYWDMVRGDELPAGIDLVAFDGAVNSGPSRGAKWLQSALGVDQDGRIGPVTLSAASRSPRRPVIDDACDRRLSFLRGLSTWAHFGRGWSSRVESVRATAHKMAAGGADVPPDVEPVPASPAPSIWAAILEFLRRIGVLT